MDESWSCLSPPRNKVTARILAARSDFEHDPLARINWWPGALRPYESPLSFCARFCELNGISLATYARFFGHNILREGELNSDELDRIASLLDEDLELVRTVFNYFVDFGDAGEHYSSESSWVAPRISKYCPRCIELGYYSYIHELPWLIKCPFHLDSLVDIPPKLHYTESQRLSDVNTLTQLLIHHCRTWPRASESDFEISNFVKNGYFRLVSSWIRDARKGQVALSQRKLWESEFDHGEPPAIGRLRRIAKMPRLIEPLFTTPNEEWSLAVRHFPLEAGNALQTVSKYASFGTIFSYYKSLAPYFSDPPPYIEKLRFAKTTLHDRHGKCRCQWGKRNAGWLDHWMEMDPDGWPYWLTKCPYSVAIEELELGWGDADQVLSRGLAEQRQQSFIEQSRIMRDAGLIEYAVNAKVAPSGHLGWSTNIGRDCEWKEPSPLTELMNTAAEFEIDVALVAAIKWLDAIEQGAAPDALRMPSRCVRLCETNNGLSLTKWSPKQPRRGSKHS